MQAILAFVPGRPDFLQARPAAAMARICGVRLRALCGQAPSFFESPPGRPVKDTVLPRRVLKRMFFFEQTAMLILRGLGTLRRAPRATRLAVGLRVAGEGAGSLRDLCGRLASCSRDCHTRIPTVRTSISHLRRLEPNIGRASCRER